MDWVGDTFYFLIGLVLLAKSLPTSNQSKGAAGKRELDSIFCSIFIRIRKCKEDLNVSFSLFPQPPQSCSEIGKNRTERERG